MTQHSAIHDRLRQILDAKPQLTQRALAAKLGVNPAAVNRMLYGQRRIRAEEVPLIEEYIGESLNVGAAPQRKSAANLPVIRFAAGARKTIDYVDAHPAVAGIDDAFAVYADDDTMQPRYFKGEIAYIHPHRPVEAPCDALVVMADGRAMICRLTRIDGDRLTVETFAAGGQKQLDRTQAVEVYRIIGRG